LPTTAIRPDVQVTESIAQALQDGAHIGNNLVSGTVVD